jgi:hypothetical protein
MLTAKRLGEYLRERGFPVVSTAEPDDMGVEDGEVQVTPLVHVQVGHDYLIVVREEDGKFWFGSERKRLDAVVSDLRAALAESGEGT